MGTQRHTLRIGKARKSDQRHDYVPKFLAELAPNSRRPVVIIDNYAPPKDTVKNLRRLLRHWESHPVTTQAEFDARVKARPADYASLPSSERRRIDRELGILDWKVT